MRISRWRRTAAVWLLGAGLAIALRLSFAVPGDRVIAGLVVTLLLGVIVGLDRRPGRVDEGH